MTSTISPLSVTQLTPATAPFLVVITSALLGGVISDLLSRLLIDYALPKLPEYILPIFIAYYNEDMALDTNSLFWQNYSGTGTSRIANFLPV